LSFIKPLNIPDCAKELKELSIKAKAQMFFI
jgi:hypothetical protein